jgi:hypothetical protein
MNIFKIIKSKLLKKYKLIKEQHIEEQRKYDIYLQEKEDEKEWNKIRKEALNEANKITDSQPTYHIAKAHKFNTLWS